MKDNSIAIAMYSRLIFLVVGAAFIYHQVLATSNEDLYIAEMLVESNVTLDAQTILSVLNSTSDFEVEIQSVNYTVTLKHSELVSECLLAGDLTDCQCAAGYIWSNAVCENYNCCRETPCKQNMSHVIPLCIAKVQVSINGTVDIGTPWDSTKTTMLEVGFKALNGFEYLNVTGQRPQMEGTLVDFEAAVSVKFKTSTLQDIVTKLESDLDSEIRLDTLGMVTIEAPQSIVCYESEPQLKCSFEEETESSALFLSRPNEYFQLNDGSVVKLNTKCGTQEFRSCVAVTLHKVTGIWSGSYHCGFTSGSVRHTAKTNMAVALLPDEITLTTSPLTADCSEKQDSENVPIEVTATIKNSTENYNVWWTYREGNEKHPLSNKSDGDNLVYTFEVPISCVKSEESHVVDVTFQNRKPQKKTSRVVIPVIYGGVKICSEEKVNEDLWPKTPDGDTVIIRKCAPGRVGYKSRTCEGSTWQPVYSSCVNQELKKVSNAAENFLKGLGATQEVAEDIFKGLLNSSSTNSDSNDTDSIADVSASVNVLQSMASASENFILEEDVLPDFVNSASNMLNKTWNGVNKTILHDMSSTYLESVEGLVRNIKVNETNAVKNDLSTPNLDLKFCSGQECNVSVFNIHVNLNKTSGILKTVAVKNLMDKLENNFDDTVTSSLLVSATLGVNNNQSVEISLKFPEELDSIVPICVFWDTKKDLWSKSGCFAKTNGNNTVCTCNHLTSFSVLMAKGDISTDILDIITTVGMGVSICSLLIFLLVESLVWSAVVKTNLSHFRHTAIVNIATFLLLADCSFLASAEAERLSDTWCLALTVCKHLFFLAMFSWMLCMSVMLVHQLIFVFSPLRKRVFMFFSGIIGYVCPILIVGSSYVYCRYTDKPYYDRKKGCWLVYERLLEGSLHAFLLPVGTVILTNLFSMVVVILTLVKSNVPEGTKADDKETVKSILKVVVFLTPVFGLTWIIGFALLLLDHNNPMFSVANYAFTILNSFQGLFLLITGCFAEQKVREEVLKLIMSKSKGNTESTKNLTTYTKDK